MTDLRDHDLQLIEPWERQCDRDAAIERECEELAALPLNELCDLLSNEQQERLEKHLREWILDTFGTDIAEQRIDAR